MPKVSGICNILINGKKIFIKDDVEYNVQPVMTEAQDIANATVTMEKHQMVFVEGETVDRVGFDVTEFTSTKNSTVTLELGNGKAYAFFNCDYTGETNMQQKEATLKFKFVSGTSRAERIS